MKFILFLIVTETSVVPMADYQTLEECKSAQRQLEDAQSASTADLGDLMAAMTMGMASYHCFPAPDEYKLRD